jgi:hypothetical protein
MKIQETPLLPAETAQPLKIALSKWMREAAIEINRKDTLIAGRQAASGFQPTDEGAYSVALSYDPTARKVTLTPTGATFDFWVRGTKFTITGAHVSAAHSATAGAYFYYHDGNGFVWSTDPWPFDEVPICYVIWTGSDGVGYFELHTTSRDANIHRNLHYSQGTQVKTRGALSGYTLTTDSDAGVSWALAATTILDEDIELTLSAVSDGGPYTVWYRTTAGAWTFSEGNSLPFLYGTYPRWNRTSDWTLQDASANYFVNYYVFATPALETQQQIILIPGQAEHASLSLAQAETVASLSYGTLPFQEIAALYKITLGAKNTYGGTAKCRIEAVETLVGPKTSITVPAPANHNAMSGLQGGTSGEYYHLTAAQVASLGTGTGTSDHGALTGLSDDDHTQYHNDTRGDARYSLLAHTHTGVYEPADATILKDADIGVTVAAQSHNHDASAITSGTIDAARLGSGSGGSSKFLREDSTWQTIAGGGDVTGQASSVDNEIALFSSTTGKVIKRATTTGVLKASSGVIAAAVAGTDYPRPLVLVATLASDATTGANTTPISLTNLVFSYEASATYRIWFMGRVSPAAATTGCGFQFDLSSAVTSIDVLFFHQLANTGTLSGGHSIADDASVGVSSGLPGTSTYPVTGHGLLITTTNTGTAQLRFRSETTAAITAKAGFTLVVERIA